MRLKWLQGVVRKEERERDRERERERKSGWAEVGLQDELEILRVEL